MIFPWNKKEQIFRENITKLFWHNYLLVSGLLSNHLNFPWIFSFFFLLDIIKHIFHPFIKFHLVETIQVNLNFKTQTPFTSL